MDAREAHPAEAQRKREQVCGAEVADRTWDPCRTEDPVPFHKVGYPELFEMSSGIG
jgi:hypothetical protein